MTWIRRQPAKPEPCRCQTPVTDHMFRTPVGQYDDLWRCDLCGQLWRIGYRCDFCDRHRPGSDPRCQDSGDHFGLSWRHATWWQEWRYRKYGRRQT